MPFTRVESAHLGAVELRPEQLLVVNCPGQLGQRDVLRIRDFVTAGGSLFTTDWALRHVLEPAFPDTVAYNEHPTADDVVRVEVRDTENPFLRGVIDPGEDPLWWLEASSYPIRVLDPAVEVLLASTELQTKYGEAPVAVLFHHGQGEVFHMISHYYLQRTELREARHQLELGRVRDGQGCRDEPRHGRPHHGRGRVGGELGSAVRERGRAEEASCRRAREARWSRCVISRSSPRCPVRSGSAIRSRQVRSRSCRSSAGSPRRRYRLAAEAIADGTLSIGEIGGGQVPQLGVRNMGELPALLVEGEHLQGAMQDRVLNVTVLVPAKADTEDPGLVCRAGPLGLPLRATVRMRRRSSRPPHCGRSRPPPSRPVDGRWATVVRTRAIVWAEVARKHASLGSSSQTGAMRDAYEQRASDLEAMTRSFGRPLPEQTGVVVTSVAGRWRSTGSTSPRRSPRLWPRLVRGYAMEALGEPECQTERETARAVRRDDGIGEGDRSRCRRSRDRGRPDGRRASSPARSSGKARWSTSPRSPTLPSDRPRARAITSRVDRGSAIGIATVLDRTGFGRTERPFVSDPPRTLAHVSDVVAAPPLTTDLRFGIPWTAREGGAAPLPEGGSVIGWRRELRDARRKGRRDGRAGVPGRDDVALPFDLREILARGQEQTERVVARSRDRDQQLGAELDDLTQRAVDAEARLAEAERQRDSAQADHERRTVDDDDRLGRLQTQLEELPASEIPADRTRRARTAVAAHAGRTDRRWRPFRSRAGPHRDGVRAPRVTCIHRRLVAWDPVRSCTGR